MSTSHGHHREARPSLTYKSWMSMCRRCVVSLPYVSRGIVVCERWKKFAAFLEDMGERPSENHTLDRIDNARGYEPGNVRWSTPIEQANNRRNNVRITLGGQTKTATEWARELGIGAQTLRDRFRLGLDEQGILGIPPSPIPFDPAIIEAAKIAARERFCNLRKAVSLTQSETAQELAVAVSTVERWESGAVRVPMWAVEALVILGERMKAVGS